MDKDLTALGEAVKEAPYAESETARFLALRDVPRLGGMVMWARQIERRVEECLGRVKLLLGEDWEQGMEGKALKVGAEASGEG